MQFTSVDSALVSNVLLGALKEIASEHVEGVTPQEKVNTLLSQYSHGTITHWLAKELEKEGYILFKVIK